MSAVAERPASASEKRQSGKTEKALADVLAGRKSSAEALAELLNGDVDTEAPVKVRAPRRPKPQGKTTSVRVIPGGKGKTKRSSTPRTPKAELPEALKKKLKGATPEQHERARTILGYDPGATFKAPDTDGDMLVTYVPKWEQGRMKNGELVAGPGRSFPYLVDRGGHLSGHGFRYRSSQAEAKLKPLEEANAKRLARTAKAA